MGRPLHLILLALYTNLGEAQAKLDAIAAARTRGGTPNLPVPVGRQFNFYYAILSRDTLWHLTHVHPFPPTPQLETDHEMAIWRQSDAGVI